MNTEDKPAQDPVLHFWLLPLACLAVGAIVLGSGTNQALFIVLNRMAAYTGGGIWANLTLLGNSLVALCLLAPLVYRRPDVLWAALIAALLCAAGVYALKFGLHLDRPAAVLPADSFTIIGVTLRQKSFPSGHSATAMCLAGLLYFTFRSVPWRSLVILGAMGTGWSRIIVGAHWPVDVLGGFLVGWLCAVAGLWLGQKWRHACLGWREHALAAVFMLAPVALFFHADTGYPASDHLRYLIAGTALALALNNARRRYGAAGERVLSGIDRDLR